MCDKVKTDKLVAVLASTFLFTISFGLLLREKNGSSRNFMENDGKSTHKLPAGSLGGGA